MTTYTLQGNDSFVLNGSLLQDLADNDAVVIEFPNEMATTAIGKNGNGLIGKNEQGRIANVTIRVLLNSETDKFLNNNLNQFLNSTASYVLLNGTFTKITGDGLGNQRKRKFDLSGGVVMKNAGTMDSTVGNIDSVVAIYNLTFLNCVVSII